MRGGKEKWKFSGKTQGYGKWSKLVSLDLIKQLVKVSASVPVSTASRHRSPRHTDAFCLAFCSLVIDNENHPLERKWAGGAASDPYPAERNRASQWEAATGNHLPKETPCLSCSHPSETYRVMSVPLVKDTNLVNTRNYNSFLLSGVFKSQLSSQSDLFFLNLPTLWK